MFTGRPVAEAPTLWSPDAKSQLTGKDTDAGKDGMKQEEQLPVVRRNLRVAETERGDSKDVLGH